MQTHKELNYLRDSKQEILAALIERDGDQCAYCEKTDFHSDPNHVNGRTIDHYHSIDFCTSEGWDSEDTHSLSNLRLACKTCNARKSNRRWLPDGTLEPRGRVKVHVPRPEICDTCMNGRLLLKDEICDVCGSDPQPRSFPAYAQKRPKDCSHGFVDPADHCWLCVIGLVERRSATDVLLNGTGGE